MRQKNFLQARLQDNINLIEKHGNAAAEDYATLESKNFPRDIPDDIQKFYDELGKPFFNSETKEQIDKLAKLQVDLWKKHREHRRVIALKSQKIGISSICIIITLWHALTDCLGMELIINAQSDEQAKTHAQDLRRILLGSDKYRDYLITEEMSTLGLLKDEITKVHTIYLFNPTNPRLPTKIIVVGMSPGALLSHKRVAFIWSSDITISSLTAQRQNEVWSALLSRLANSQGPIIVECPARAPAGPVYDAYERFEKLKEEGKKIDKTTMFYVFKFTYELGIRDGFFSRKFIDAEMIALGPLFGAFYNADFFASGMTWYKEEHFKNETADATNILLQFHTTDDMISDLTED